MQIEVENLSYSYSEKSKTLAVKALDNVSLTIKSGEFFGIIGKTGSGKSTFVQHLNGLIKPNKNCTMLKVGDFDLTDKKCDYKALRSKVGMVFQYPENQLFAETVYLDVAFGLKNFYPELSEVEIEKRVKEAIEIVGLNYERVKNRSPFEFSGGQKRRIAIAGVLVSKPEVLVLDEPAAGLDPKGKREFIALLNKIHKEFVKTIVIVSHDMDLVSENCSSVAVFKDGKVVKKGSVKEVFSDTELIFDTALDLPTTVSVIEGLKNNGIELDCDYTTSDFIRAIKEKFASKISGGKIK